MVSRLECCCSNRSGIGVDWKERASDGARMMENQLPFVSFVGTGAEMTRFKRRLLVLLLLLLQLAFDGIELFALL